MSEIKRAVDWDRTAGNTSSHNQDMSDPYVQLSADLVDEEINGVGELLDSFENGDLIGTLDGCADGLKVILQLVFSLNVDPEELLKEINDSNYSKFCDNESDAKRSVESYSEDSRYKDVFYQKVGDLFVIKGFKQSQNPLTDTPKILKGIHYREPDLSRFIMEDELK